jgi:hypothetical protein
MPENRTARNEAWIASLVLHVALLAAMVAVVGRPGDAVDGPVSVDTCCNGHEIGVVLFDRSTAEPTPRSIVVPVRQEIPSPPPARTIVAPPPPPMVVRQVGHQETVPTPAVERGLPTADDPTAIGAPPVPPVTDVPGSPKASVDAPAPPLPTGAATAFFGVPAIGKSVVFVLDRSASMGLDGRLDRARRELAVSLHRLPPSARFQVIAYNKGAEPIRVHGADGLLPATAETIESVIAAVERLPAEGGSEHASALTKALALVPDVVYFLTDEDDLDMRDVQIVTRRNHGRVSIHALCLVSAAGSQSPMQTLARDNRGLFKVVER